MSQTPGGEGLDPVADLDAVLRIERASFSRPWTPAMFQQAFADPQTLTVAARDSSARVTGFALARLIADELEVLIVAVDSGHRRHGVGRRLVTALLDLASARGARHATLEVRRSNRAAQRLYERAGFRREAVRPHYYQDPPEDALIYWHHGLASP